jgi:hypothetical protein
VIDTIDTLAEQLLERPAAVFPAFVERERSVEVLQAAVDLAARRGKLTRWALLKIHVKNLRAARRGQPREARA